MSTIYYHSGMAGAPAGATNSEGGLIAVLDACLVNGMNSISVTGIVQSAGTATATTASNHNFSIGDIVEVAGATPSAYNGWQRVTAKTSNTFTFAVASGTASPATGTLTAKHPGAGWAKSFTGTNTAGYQGSTAGMGHHVQIEDNNPYADSNASARVRMAAGLTGLNAGTQMAEQCRISKGATSWLVVADSRTCYVIFGALTTLCFGELAPLFAGDAYAWFMNRGENANGYAMHGSGERVGYCGANFPVAGAAFNDGINPLGSYHGAKLLRSYSQTGGDVEAIPSTTTFNGSGYAGEAAAMYSAQINLAGTNPVDGALGLAPILLAECAVGAACVRGALRGMYQPMGLLPAGGFNAQGIQVMDDTLINGQVRRVLVSRSGVSAARTQLAFDLGAW